MGRPKLAATEKRKLYSVRLGPSERTRVEAYAERVGLGVGSVLEKLALDRLEYLEGTRSKTRDLLDRISQLIKELESETKGKWDKNLKAWSAVSEALGNVLNTDRPEPIDKDEVVQEKLAQQHRLIGERRVLVNRLARLGIAVNEDPSLPVQLSEQRLRDALTYFQKSSPDFPVSSRSWEIKAVEALPAIPGESPAQLLFERLCDLDSQIESAKKETFEEARIYVAAEEDGRQIGKEKLRKKGFIGLGGMN